MELFRKFLFAYWPKSGSYSPSHNNGVPVLTHLAESEKEREVIAKRSNGLSPIAYLDSIGALNKNLVGAHVIIADDQDIALLEKHQVGVAHNMSANIKAAKGVAPII